MSASKIPAPKNPVRDYLPQQNSPWRWRLSIAKYERRIRMFRGSKPSIRIGLPFRVVLVHFTISPVSGRCSRHQVQLNLLGLKHDIFSKWP